MKTKQPTFWRPALVLCQAFMGGCKAVAKADAGRGRRRPFHFVVTGQRCPDNLATGASPRKSFSAKSAPCRGSAPATKLLVPQSTPDKALGEFALSRFIGRGVLLLWVFAWLLMPLTAATIFVGAVECSAAQKSKLDEEEEEPPAKPATKPSEKSKLDEEEPPAKPATKPADKSKLDEEEEPPPKKDTPPKPSSSRSGLDEEEEPLDEKPKKTAPPTPKEDGEAEDETTLAYDTVHYEEDNKYKHWKIALYPDWIEKGSWPPPKEFKFQVMLKNSIKPQTYKASQVNSIEFFEDRVLDQVAESLQTKAGKLCRPGEAFDQSQAAVREQVPKAERLLLRAIQEHDSAVQSNLRKGPYWDTKVRRRLLDAVFNLRLGKIDLLLAQQAYAQVVAQAGTDFDQLRIGGATPDDPREQAIRGRMETALLVPARKAADAGDYEAARRLLGDLVNSYPNQRLPVAAEFAQRLKDEAGKVMERAHEVAESDPARAQELIEEAAGIWPELPKLNEMRQEIGGGYPILECAYQELPHELSPLAAQTPVERQAVSLLFESLVRWSADEQTGGHHAPQLAEGRPVPLARGRQFQLPRLPACRWSDYRDDEPHICTAADVGFTVELMKKHPGASAPPAWGHLIDSVDHSDSFLADIRLNRDHWQPMSLMDFHVLPRNSFREGGSPDELARFSKQPIGTGPYVLAEQSEDLVRFMANPNYRRPDRPRIREIRFRRTEQTDAFKQFDSDDIQLIYALTTQQVIELESANKNVVRLKTPSVWFLAPNYRRQALRNQSLRLAIANSIDRKEILNQYFRTGRDTGDHAELTGPFPAKSWAYNSAVPKFALEKAKTFADLARKDLETIPKLKLVYPSGQEDVENACKQIAAGLAAVGIELDLQPAVSGGFYTQVLYSHDFDLAYWRHDFHDETYWLGPLLDGDDRASAEGGPNFMAYKPDAAVAEFLSDLGSHKRFPTVQKLMHKLHAHLAQTAVVIPLWQLDTYVAVSDRLTASPEPLSLFANVEEWELKPKTK